MAGRVNDNEILEKCGEKREEHLSQAIKLLIEARAQCSTTQTDMEADVKLHIARWEREKNNHEIAMKRAEEALSLAESWDSSLKKAEANNFVALLLLEAGKTKEARDHAKRALKFAEGDGPEHCYLSEFIKAKQLLSQLS